MSFNLGLFSEKVVASTIYCETKPGTLEEFRSRIFSIENYLSATNFPHHFSNTKV